MNCQLCNRPAQFLTPVATYTAQGLRVCSDCETLIRRYKAKPYSKLMDAVAQAEAGYYINRKRERR